MTRDVEFDAAAKEVVDCLLTVVGGTPIKLHEPIFDGNEWYYLKECLDSTYVSSVGRYVDEFEKSLANYTQSGFAVAVVNGTSALQISLKLAGVCSGDEVLVQSLTFVGTINAITYCGALPHFVEVEEETLGIDTDKLRNYLKSNTTFRNGFLVNKNSGRIIRGIVPMHTFGHPSRIDSLVELANDFGIFVVEDSAEAIGSKFRGKHTGTFGTMGILSFNGNKTITTGGGGAILTNDQKTAEKARYLTTTARIKHLWEYVHDEVGYNFRMPNLNAALGVAQLERIEHKLSMKRELFTRYQNAFRELSYIEIFKEPKDALSNYWLQTLILKDEYAGLRDLILDMSHRSGIQTRPAWRPIHNMSAYSSAPKMEMTVTDSLYKRIINIPSNFNYEIQSKI